MRANKPLFQGDIPAWKKSALRSRLLRKSVQATKPAAVPVVAIAGAISRKCPKNQKE
jgi:hypothetical protein